MKQFIPNIILVALMIIAAVVNNPMFTLSVFAFIGASSLVGMVIGMINIFKTPVTPGMLYVNRMKMF